MKPRRAIWFAPVLLILLSASEARAENRPPDLVEYENLILSPLWGPDEKADPRPNYREIYLRRIAQYEAFLKKYPNSSLVPEVKLQIANFSNDVERPEVHPIMLKEERCLDEATSVRGRERCMEERDFALRSLGSVRDPVYVEKARRLRQEIISVYGHKRHYAMLEPRPGGFQEIDEDLGAYILYNEAVGMKLCEKAEVYRKILREYRIRDSYRKDILKFLEDFRDSLIRC